MKTAGLTSSLLVAATSATSVAPVEKVLTMLREMKVKGDAMMKDEQKVYAEYKEWVDDRSTELGFEIKTADRSIEEHLAFIQKADTDVARLADEIGTLDGDISRLEGEKKDATEVREKERSEFSKVQQDLSESVDALERAVTTVGTQNFDREQAQALLERAAEKTPGANQALLAFAQMGQRRRSLGAPAVAAYESQTGGVLELLENLLKKFKAELDSEVTAEGEKAHNYDLLMIHLSNAITKSKSDRDDKSVNKAKIAEASANAKGELASTRKAKAEDQKFLADMTAQFGAKTSTFKENQKVRADELEALKKAIDIIASPEVADSYTEHIKSFAQVKPHRASAVLLQTRRASLSAAQRASELLLKRAGVLSSDRLSTLAAAMTTSPFDKVIDMVQSLIEKLKAEAASEAEHKQFCDEELKKNKLKRDKKSATADRLSAEAEALAGKIQTFASEIDTLISEQQKLTSSMNEATTMRQGESKKNADTISDAKAGASAVKQALVVLKEFYSKQESFVQAQSKQVPEMAAYSGMGGAKTGVVGMLEVIQSDFARLEADTTAAERQAASEYEAFMRDAQVDKKLKHDTEFKTKLEKDQAEFELSRTKKDLSAVQEELAKANGYYAELKPMCLEVHVSYEERVAKRQEEIEALKRAHEILDSKA
eukprot:TRINITY_DN4314_c0_g1_i1.p1 TRINITY_DN4314_c0_g1~~TRINITY_DN4314_c0_g1_i1.p1  ORF type:complete len:675 (+),score=171.35 TRINITY_DN4314_c0_g1_i1:54-2027(+)